MNVRSELKAEKPADAEGVADNAGAAGESVVPRKKRGGARRVLLMFGVPLVLVAGGGYFWLTGGRYEDTDNAYVRQPIVALSADVSGRVIKVAVGENQAVKKGDVLFTMDPAPFRISLDKAEASLAAARLNVEQLRVSYKTAVAKLDAAKQTLSIRQRAQDRVDSLTDKGISTQSASDTSLLALQQAEADVDLSGQAVAAAVAALDGNPNIAADDLPSVKLALAAVDDAQRDLANTSIVAPADGVVSQIDNLNVGQFVGAGTIVADLVETGSSWVEANFKETQLGTIRAGQPAEIKIDTFAGAPLKGVVGSIGAATGSEFSLIPAQNATGNWVKVVQRVPVRIEFGGGENMPRLRAGMSAEVTVDTGRSALDKLMGK